MTVPAGKKRKADDNNKQQYLEKYLKPVQVAGSSKLQELPKTWQQHHRQQPGPGPPPERPRSFSSPCTREEQLEATSPVLVCALKLVLPGKVVRIALSVVRVQLEWLLNFLR